uniref:Cytidylyltransferase family protein n=1 Tax=Fervidicoccus fontis TaxID=683846 RepID=A0A7J3SL11_9CREN
MSEACERASLYISMVKDALQQAKEGASGIFDMERKLIELSELYLKDSEYYLSLGDCATAIATISYAEGLIDSLAIQGKIKIKWRRIPPKRVVIAGTFDVLHPGHLHFIKAASRLGEVFVIVSRDINAKRAKGRDTIFPEQSRLEMVKAIRWVKDAVLGDENDYLKKIVELSPDIVLLGPDQKVNEGKLKEELEKRGLGNVEVMRLEKRDVSFFPNSTTSIILEIVRRFCVQSNDEEHN